MAVYFITGKLGAGKTLAAVWRIAKYLQSGRPVATNLDLYLEHWPRPDARDLRVTRLPDKPTARDLDLLGKGNESYDEDKNGLVVLDECGTWFNTRTWADKDRAALIGWFLHACKLGWDVIFIVQDLDVVDKQARECLAEHTVFCKRMDRMTIPVIGFLLRSLGVQKMLPRIHIGVVVYGDTRQHPIVDRWFYRGEAWQKLYDTKQAFRPEFREYVQAQDPANPAKCSPGLYSMLTPWHLKGRYGVGRWSLSAVLARLGRQVVQLVALMVVLSAATVTGRSPATVAASWGLMRPQRSTLIWRDGPV